MANIELKNIDKTFGQTQVIKDVNLSIQDREFVVFVGPSGCGKSTLLRLISGLEDLTEGEIYIDDERIDHLSPSQRGIAMVFQSYALYPHMSVYQNMSYALKVAKTPKDEIDQKVKKAAEILQLTELLDRKPKALSGGQRQRVAIGRAIVRNPKIFLFDEPLSNLDAKLRVQMRIELTKLHKQLDATMIYVTHDQIEAMTMADKIVVLRDGIIEQFGAPLELYNSPANKFVASFIGSPAMNFIDAKIVEMDGTSLKVDIGDELKVNFDIAENQNLNIGDVIEVGIRPEHILLADLKNDFITASILTSERLGGETYIYLENEYLKDFIIHASEDVDAKMDDEIKFGFDPTQAHLFRKDGSVITRLEREG